jgi:hypothetical protein
MMAKCMAGVFLVSSAVAVAASSELHQRDTIASGLTFETPEAERIVQGFTRPYCVNRVFVRALRVSGSARTTPTIGPASDYATEIRLRQPDRYLRIFSTGNFLHHRGFSASEILNSVMPLDPSLSASLTVLPTDLTFND